MAFQKLCWYEFNNGVRIATMSILGAILNSNSTTMKPREYRNIPRRLIAVGFDDGQVRLCETNCQKSTYLALSYCWGTSRRLICLSSNFEALKTKIETHELARTVQDAIWVTRQLGFAY